MDKQIAYERNVGIIPDPLHRLVLKVLLLKRVPLKLRPRSPWWQELEADLNGDGEASQDEAEKYYEGTWILPVTPSKL